MQPVSADLLAALRGAPALASRVDVWRAGQLVARDLPVASGTVTITAGQGVRGLVDLVVQDPDGALAPRLPGDPLAPYGQELVVRAGVRLGGVTEWVVLGWFGIQEVTVTEGYTAYTRAGEPEQVWASRGATITVRAADRLQKVSDARFIAREQPARATVFAEAERLLQACAVPWKPPAAPVVNASIPSGVTYDDDRLGALTKLATVVGAEVAATPHGAVTMVPAQADLAAAPSWVATADEPLHVSVRRGFSRTGLYNAAVSRGATTDGSQPLQAVRLADPGGPLDPYGPFGLKPYFHTSNLLTTQAAVDAAAVTTLARVSQVRRMTVPVEMVPNPALECGDLVQLPAPRGVLVGEVRSISFNLVPGPMALQLSVDPESWGSVV